MATADTNQQSTVNRTGAEALPPEAQDKAPTRAAELGQIARDGGCPTNAHESFSDSTYEEQAHLAEREMSSFVSAVTKLYGPEQATLSAQDWLDQAELTYSQPLSRERHWRAVTIAASARLADRLNTTGSR